MRRIKSITAGVVVLAIAGCGDNIDGGPGIAGPFDDVELTQELAFDGLDGPIHIVRDRFGIAHISAQTSGDAAFAQGYVMAHDRLPQLDILRRFGAGTLSELFGSLSEDVIETDLAMRMHRMRAVAEDSYEELRASSDPDDARIVVVLDRYADGVNAYHQQLVAGDYALDPAVTFSSDRFTPWSPVDSLVVGRFQGFSLSFSAPVEIQFTDMYQSAVDTFDLAPAPGELDHDPARYARRGASRDLIRYQPIGRVAPLDGAPGVAPGAAPGKSVHKSSRVRVPEHLLRDAQRTFAEKLPTGPRSFMVPNSGSNNWAISPEHAGGTAMLAGDQHLEMPNPSIFYPTHLTVEGEFDIEGITLPGVPMVVLGHNGQVAWTSTTAFHDVDDTYLETIVPCTNGGGDCVIFDGGEVAIETFTETFEIGALGTILDTRQFTYEFVPHHGPIIPAIAGGQIVAREGNAALSVRYTGHSPTSEIRALWKLAHARSVEDGMDALGPYEVGAQNWLFIDNLGSIGWSAQARVPLRSAASYSWDPVTNPGGVAPFMVMPGTGEFEWETFMDAAQIPHSLNPATGYLATANSDPVGATFDGNPLNGPIVDGRPQYLGGTYVAGFRMERVDTLIQDRLASGAAMTLDDMADMQHDVQALFARRIQPHLVASLGAIDDPDRLQDVTDWIATQSSETLDRLRQAASYLANWSLNGAAAVRGSPSADEIADAVATSIFNVWAHFFVGASVGDEFSAMNHDVRTISDHFSLRPALAVFAEPDSLASGLAVTGQPVLCDDMTTDSVIESCDRIALQAMEDALAWLESGEAFATRDMDQWVWGRIHTLTLRPLFPEPSLNLPPSNDPDPDLRSGYPLANSNFAVRSARCGYNDLNFEAFQGSAQRFLAEVEPGGTVRARMALPGGTIWDRSSPHYRDLMDDYFMALRHFDLPYSSQEIVTAGEERWLMRSP